MKIIADLHIHSRFSRATSKDLTIENLEKYANIKGINLIGTGDFTHPKWIEDLKSNLKEDGTGILKTKNNFPFILQTEISSIYTEYGKGRKVHNVILAPSFEVVDQITEFLLKKGRVDYDGRPIFKLPCDELVESMMKISKDIEVIPAHVWTPYFGLFGSMSGFDSVEEAFKDQAKNIHALETGLSSDPLMNWRLSQLDRFSLVSSSDLHSFWPWRIGREATLFDLKNITYQDIINALRTKQGLEGTIEVDPGYGKYHFDGHRNCKVCLAPKNSIKIKNICPKCGKPLTIGVLHRVEQLADREEGFKPEGAKNFYSLIPISELISTQIKSPVASKKTWEIYNKLIKGFGNEFNILLDAKKEDMIKVVDEKIADIILKNREGKITIQPGFDGEYGKPLLSEKDLVETEIETPKFEQKGLSDF
ncbi:MAG: endonuclease Q family protein [Nanoarchaeota archaeon]|nr:endonuclease Q family protein [Nanoarchaeota archaeon]MBU1005660.1 endonuclease Q family protein [Nanoarchaeota archaeon]MBU1946915.1 endonuclease Q family protein [Nanoarchaeota archaeon]